MKKFDGIRPYGDHEVSEVVGRLLESDELIRAVIHTQFSHTPSYLERPLAAYLRHRLARHLKTVRTVADFQGHMMKFLEKTIRSTIIEFTSSGCEKLDQKPSIFISNHRDITLDSALLNYALKREGWDTAEIAVGDNLMSNALVGDLLRLNKSFVVPRSVNGRKEKLRALTTLSHYIYRAHGDGRSIWLAQREGRAKDGFDRTDPAIIKMLYLWPRKLGMDFNATLAHLNLVPVSISYEYDPCDGLKAAERQAREAKGYTKQGHEDLESILLGITKPKGRVHIHLGSPLQGTYASAREVAAALDQQIINNYKLFPPAWLALERLLSVGKSLCNVPEEARIRLRELVYQARSAWPLMDTQDAAQQTKDFAERLAAYPERLQQHILEMYANPLLSKYLISS